MTYAAYVNVGNDQNSMTTLFTSLLEMTKIARCFVPNGAQEV